MIPFSSFCFFFFLLTINIRATRGDEVTFEGHFLCNISSRADNFCMLLRYMEEDSVENDVISIGKVECGGPKSSLVHTNFHGGDGFFDHHYEFFVAISHTCTQDGKIRLHRYHFPQIEIDATNKRFNYTVDLTEQGFSIDDYFDWHMNLERSEHTPDTSHING